MIRERPASSAKGGIRRPHGEIEFYVPDEGTSTSSAPGLSFCRLTKLFDFSAEAATQVGDQEEKWAYPGKYICRAFLDAERLLSITTGEDSTPSYAWNVEAYIDLAPTRDDGALRVQHGPVKISQGNRRTCVGWCYRIQLSTTLIICSPSRMLWFSSLRRRSVTVKLVISKWLPAR